MGIILAPGETKQIDVVLTWIPGWLSPTGYTSPTAWSYPWHIYDGNIRTVAYGQPDESRWTPWLELTFPDTPVCSKVLLKYLYIPQIYLIMDVYDGVSYHRVDDGTILHTSTDLEITFTPQVVTKVRLRTKRVDRGLYAQNIGELMCWRIE